jgi:hypothetical protein
MTVLLGVLSVLLATQAFAQTIGGGQGIGGGAAVESGSGTATKTTIGINNANPGTTLNLWAVNGATAVTATTATTSTAPQALLGVCTVGCGNSGTATIQNGGLVNCVFDGGVTYGDLVGLSQSVNGDCTDLGPTPGTAISLGTVMSATNASAGTYQVNIFSIGGAGSNGALIANNNLSDLQSTSLARTHLGLGLVATLNQPSIGGLATTPWTSLEQWVYHALPTTSSTLTCTGTSGTFPFNDDYMGSLSGANVTLTLPTSGCADGSIITIDGIQDGGHTITVQTGASGGLIGTLPFLIGSTAGNQIEEQWQYCLGRCGTGTQNAWVLRSDNVNPQQAQPANVQILTSGTSYTTPTNATALDVILVGGAGAGGGAQTGGSAAHSGGGGAGGNEQELLITGTLASSYTYAIGAGGTAGACNSGASNTGGNGAATTWTVSGTTFTTSTANGGGAATTSTDGAGGATTTPSQNYSGGPTTVAVLTNNGGGTGTGGSGASVGVGGSKQSLGGSGEAVTAGGACNVAATAGSNGFIIVRAIGAF